MKLIDGRWVSDEEIRAREEDSAFAADLARTRARLQGVRLEQPSAARPADWSQADFAAAVARVCHTAPERILNGTPEKIALAVRAGRARRHDFTQESY